MAGSKRPDTKSEYQIVEQEGDKHQGLWQLMFCLLTIPAKSHIVQKQFFPEVVQEISSQRAVTTTQNVLLLHDNASPH